MSSEKSVAARESDTSYFVKLPTELLIQVINEVAVDDLDPLSSTCHRIRTLAEKRLMKHRKLKRAYTTVTLNDQSAKLGPHGTFVNFLSILARNPDFVFYPRRLSITVPSPSGRPPLVSQETQNERSKDDRVKLRRIRGTGKYLRKCLFILDSLKADWCISICRSVVRPNKGCVYSLFLAVLPNLRDLTIDDSDSDCFHIMTIMESIISVDSPSNTTALQNLRRVTLTSENFTTTYFKYFSLWTHVTSLRYLSITHLALDYTMRLDQMDSLGVSNITELVLKYCILHEPQLRRILEKFRYIEGPAYSASPAVMVQSLVDSCGEKLQKLTLRCANYMTDPPSFNDLRALKKLDITTDPFIHKELEDLHAQNAVPRLNLDPPPLSPLHLQTQPDVAKFVDILPPTIEVITLKVKNHWRVARFLLAGMARESQKKLPKLNEISIGGFQILMESSADERAVRLLLREVYELTDITVKT
ncbi:hypothetical protein MMC30_004781 [Trapelia coarctata]|nr:hypothetical protein [Trapelia coarctata]